MTALPWPDGWPRTKPGARKAGGFSAKGPRNDYGYTPMRRITVAQAIQRVQDEVRRFGGSGLRVDTGLRTRLDGLPYSGQAAPEDPGCVVSFRLPGGKPVVFPCDRYTEVAQNLAAVAATLEAKRAIERHGVSTLEREFEGYAALPSGDAAADAAASVARPIRVDPWPQGRPDPRRILQVAPDAPLAVCEAAYKAQALALHPDRPGGDAVAMERANWAIQQIRNPPREA